MLRPRTGLWNVVIKRQKQVQTYLLLTAVAVVVLAPSLNVAHPVGSQPQPEQGLDEDESYNTQTGKNEVDVSPPLSLTAPANGGHNSQLYLNKLEFARRLAACFMQGKNRIPQVDPASLLVVEAECQTEECKDCVKKTEECDRKKERHGYKTDRVRWDSVKEEDFCLQEESDWQRSSVDLIAKAYSTSSRQHKGYQAEDPQIGFHCYRTATTTSAAALNNNNTLLEAYYKLDSRWLNRVLERDRTTSDGLIPHAFVVEQSDGSGNVQVFVTLSWLFTMRNLVAGREYGFAVTPVAPHVTYNKSVVPYRSFADPIDWSHHKERPRNLVYEYDLNALQYDKPVNLTIRWESGHGENASCDSDLHFFDHEDFVTLEIRSAAAAFWKTLLKNLSYGRNYSVKIEERLGKVVNLETTGHAFHVPSCFQVYNNSFQHCAPARVTEIKIVEKDRGVLITWKPPQYTSADNPVSGYNVSVTRMSNLPPKHSGSSPHALSTLPVPLTSTSTSQTVFVWGNKTQLKVGFANFTKPGRVHVTIRAVSAGGVSESAVEVQQFEDPPAPISLLEKIWLAVMMSVLFIGCLIGGGAWVKYYRDKMQRKKQRHEYFENLEKESFPLDPTSDPYASKWEINSGALVLGDVIGEGAFGLVRKAVMYKDGHKMLVAVKTLRDGLDEKESSKFWEEFNILKSLEPHKHVVGLVGIVKAHVPALVVEYCQGGDLQSHLRKANQSKTDRETRFSKSSSASTSTYESATGVIGIPVRSESRIRMTMVTNETYFLKDADHHVEINELDLLSYARQIACGMEFLSSNRIVHRDLAARNVLIGSNRTLKIADFGLSRDVYEQNWYKKSSNGKIPIKWLAIECLLQEVYTTKSDVWSYGILLWEIVTFGGNPYPGVENTKIFDLLKSGYRMSQPENCSNELYTLMSQCWSEKPMDRPDFGSIRRKLDDIMENSDLVVYMNLAHGDDDDNNDDSEREEEKQLCIDTDYNFGNFGDVSGHYLQHQDSDSEEEGETTSVF